MSEECRCHYSIRKKIAGRRKTAFAIVNNLRGNITRISPLHLVSFRKNFANMFGRFMPLPALPMILPTNPATHLRSVLTTYIAGKNNCSKHTAEIPLTVFLQRLQKPLSDFKFQSNCFKIFLPHFVPIFRPAGMEHLTISLRTAATQPILLGG